MPLTASLITAACLTATNINNQACNKALDASSQQTGFRNTSDKLEAYVIRSSGEAVEAIVIAGTYSYKTYRNRSVTFKLFNFRCQLGLDNSNLGVTWSF